MKIYIGGISSDVTSAELLDLYSQYGKVSKVDLLKDETGLNRGYAFVEMDDEQSAESAILGTNNTLMGSQNIQVSISRSRLDQKRERQKKGKPSGGKFFQNRRQPREQGRDQMKDQGRTQIGEQNQNRAPRSYQNNPKTFNNSNDDSDKYNRIDHNANNIKKGVDYGRSGKPSPQMSFLGQEGFATSIRTVDPVYSSNANRRPETTNNFRKNNGNTGNTNRRPNFNKGRKPNFGKRFDKKPEEGNSSSIFQPNTSDIIGNLE